jgi:N-acetylglucosamine-6-phosphate deacetylase
MPAMVSICNCRLFDAAAGSPTVDLEIENGKIAAINPSAARRGSGAVIDAGGRETAPGLIDVHIQGAGGADVLDGTEEALRAVSVTCARFGVTGFLATTVYRPARDNRHLEIAAGCCGRDLGGARLLGIHLEGPFISPQKRGMIQPSCLCSPSEQALDDILRLCRGKLRMMTIAPEIAGSLETVRRLCASDVIASLGHSLATYEQTLEGIEAGITHATHLFNAMPSLHHRAPGPLLALAGAPQVSAQIIPDGVHLHPAVVKCAWDLFGPSRSVAITDGMQAIGLPEGGYVYNGIPYESKGGTARYHDGTLIGTALGLSELVARLQRFTGCSRAEALRSATEVPLRILGMHTRAGRIAAGLDADLAIFNADGSVWAAVVGGVVVYGHNATAARDTAARIC